MTDIKIFTARQRRFLSILSKTRSYDETAEEMGITKRSVYRLVSNIKKRVRRENDA